MLKLDLDVNSIIDSYNKGRTIKSISIACNCSQSSILRLLRKYGVKSNPKNSSSRKRKYYLNEDFFNEINSQEKAYILGYLYADGYNNTERGAVTLTISKKDEHILYDMKQYFTEVPIKNYVSKSGYKPGQIESRLRIDSIKISTQLERLGCGNNKSLNLQFPNFISIDMMPHFIRGYLDGDGCISISNNRCAVSIIGSLDFVKSFIDYVKCKLNLIFHISFYKKNDSIADGYCNNRNDCLVFLDWIYKDSKIHLDRKYKKYLELKDKGISYYGFGNKGLANLNGDKISCPRCTSFLIHKRGFEKGKRRYQCNECNRAFTANYSNFNQS